MPHSLPLTRRVGSNNSTTANVSEWEHRLHLHQLQGNWVRPDRAGEAMGALLEGHLCLDLPFCCCPPTGLEWLGQTQHPQVYMQHLQLYILDSCSDNLYVWLECTVSCFEGLWCMGSIDATGLVQTGLIEWIGQESSQPKKLHPSWPSRWSMGRCGSGLHQPSSRKLLNIANN